MATKTMKKAKARDEAADALAVEVVEDMAPTEVTQAEPAVEEAAPVREPLGVQVTQPPEPAADPGWRWSRRNASVRGCSSTCRCATT